MRVTALRRIGLHGLLLALINILSVILGYIAYFGLRTSSQLAVQVPIALVATFLCFVAWLRFSSSISSGVILHGSRELLYTYVAALVWSPVLFYPLHFTTQGYVSSFGNVVGLWAFQLVANLPALHVRLRVPHRKD